MGALAEETILAFPSPLTPTRHARSTILLGSISSLRDAGRFDDYAARLPPAHRDALLSAVAGSWIPLDIAISHYAACDALDFPIDQQAANGRATFDKTRATILGTMIRMARESGVTPWNIFPLYQRFWDRGYDGGGLRVTRLGPKEARMDVTQCRLADSRYFRNALRGLGTGVLELFARKAYVTEAPGKRPPASAAFRMQWV